MHWRHVELFMKPLGILKAGTQKSGKKQSAWKANNTNNVTS